MKAEVETLEHIEARAGRLMRMADARYAPFVRIKKPMDKS
jgi:hypothetical protein